MSDGPSPPQRDAFAILMSNATPVCPPDDPWYTTVIYEAHLEHVDESEPLWRVPYFGQVVRSGTAEENFEDRKRQHETDTIRDPKDLGFHAVIGMYGADKLAWRVLSSKPGRRSEVQAWANAEEIRLIDAHGGVLRDMDARLKQTLNLTKGGKGDAAKVWAGIDAWRNLALTKFKAAMEAYVEVHGSALVPGKYVDDDGYKLGSQLAAFRRGNMRRGMPNEADIVAWAEALPEWHWDARESDEYREAKSQAAKDRWANASEELYVKCIEPRRRRAFTKFKAAMEAYVEEHGSALVPRKYVDEDGYQLGRQLNGFRRGRMRKGMPDQSSIEAWAEALPEWHWDARESEEYHEASVKRGKDQAANETAEQKADRFAKTRKTMATDASKAKRRKISTDQAARERCAELERARAIAVPFEKSKKRRAEMRASSTDFSDNKKGNSVLYMVSEDGATIRRVTKDGMMQRRTIVGPVVDPSVTEAAGPSDLNAAFVSDSESD
jgi:hypothetical protein